MRNTFKGKDYLAFKDMTREEIEFIVDLSLSFKQKWLAREPHRYFEGQVWACLLYTSGHNGTESISGEYPNKKRRIS